MPRDALPTLFLVISRKRRYLNDLRLVEVKRPKCVVAHEHIHMDLPALTALLRIAIHQVHSVISSVQVTNLLTRPSALVVAKHLPLHRPIDHHKVAHGRMDAASLMADLSE